MGCFQCVPGDVQTSTLDYIFIVGFISTLMFLIEVNREVLPSPRFPFFVLEFLGLYCRFVTFIILKATVYLFCLVGDFHVNILRRHMSCIYCTTVM